MSKTERLFHPRTLVIHPDFKNLEEFIVSIPERFQRNEGTVIHQGRNELRKMEYNGKEYVIKSFHSPHLINRFVYGIFRPSKAKRSYDHAEMLLKIGVGTPQPVGYMNIRSGLLFDKSYYISLLSTCPYHLRQPVHTAIRLRRGSIPRHRQSDRPSSRTRIRPQRLRTCQHPVSENSQWHNNRNCRFEPDVHRPHRYEDRLQKL